MKITVELENKKTVVLEGDALIGCIINHKTDTKNSDGEDPSSAGILLGRCGKKEVLVRAALSLGTMVNNVLDNPIEAAFVRFAMKEMISGSNDFVKESYIYRNEITPVEPEGGDADAE